MGIDETPSNVTIKIPLPPFTASKGGLLSVSLEDPSGAFKAQFATNVTSLTSSVPLRSTVLTIFAVGLAPGNPSFMVIVLSTKGCPDASSTLTTFGVALILILMDPATPSMEPVSVYSPAVSPFTESFVLSALKANSTFSFPGSAGLKVRVLRSFEDGELPSSIVPEISFVSPKASSSSRPPFKITLFTASVTSM